MACDALALTPFKTLISASCVKAFIIDDSVINRNRSKKTFLPESMIDTTGRLVRGYSMLTLDWSDVNDIKNVNMIHYIARKCSEV